MAKWFAPREGGYTSQNRGQQRHPTATVVPPASKYPAPPKGKAVIKKDA